MTGIVETLDDSINIKCFYVHKYKVFNFQSVQNKTADQEIKTTKGKAYVNNCQDTITKINKLTISIIINKIFILNSNH